MFYKQIKTKGFTLIELLVVVAIIGLLSSVVMASLNSARNKAKDAAIKEEVSQWVSLMNLNYNDYGDYCNLVPNAWMTLSGVTCDTMYEAGIYATQARAICNNIWKNAGEIGWGAPGNWKILVYTNPATCSNSYSIEVYLNDGKWFCSGSSGAKGEYTTHLTNPGCFDIP